MVARKLDSRLRDHMASSRGVNAFSGQGSEGSFGRSRASSFHRFTARPEGIWGATAASRPPTRDGSASSSRLCSPFPHSQLMLELCPPDLQSLLFSTGMSTSSRCSRTAGRTKPSSTTSSA